MLGFKRARHGNPKGATHREPGGKEGCEEEFSVCSQPCPLEGSVELPKGPKPEQAGQAASDHPHFPVPKCLEKKIPT